MMVKKNMWKITVRQKALNEERLSRHCIVEVFRAVLLKRAFGILAPFHPRSTVSSTGIHNGFHDPVFRIAREAVRENLQSPTRLCECKAVVWLKPHAEAQSFEHRRCWHKPSGVHGARKAD